MKVGSIYLKFFLVYSCLGWALPSQAQVLNRPDFFRRGYEQMQQQIQQLQTSPSPEDPTLILKTQPSVWQWQKVVFQPAGFSVWMPEAPQSQESLELETSLGKIPFSLVASHPQSWRFVAAYSAPIEVELLRDIEAFFAAMRQGIIEKTKFQLTEEKSVTFQGFIGQQWQMENNQEIIQFRAYLINRKVYLLAARQAKPSSEGAAQIVTGFFDSFALLKE